LNFKLPNIYPITDTRISGLSHAEQVDRLAAGGATLIQLREKYASSYEFYAAAEEAIRVAHNLGVRIIINDRVDIALALRADGVHLGQDDMPPDKAREILGDGAIIGFSTHSLEQALAAVKLPVDYVAFGPVFGTTTKTDSDESVGRDGLSGVRAGVGDLPLVAIGGIDAGNLQSVLETGADSAALISALLSAPSKIEERMRRLIMTTRFRN